LLNELHATKMVQGFARNAGNDRQGWKHFCLIAERICHANSYLKTNEFLLTEFAVATSMK